MNRLAPYSGFHQSNLVASGSLGQVALAVKAMFADVHVGGALIFDNSTGRVVDIDFRGSDNEILARLPAEPSTEDEPAEALQRGPGRPKLGVVAREVTLPDGTILAWTGQFEHEARARATLRVIVPLVLALIFVILYWTYHDLADAALMMLAIPGAAVGAWPVIASTRRFSVQASPSRRV